MTRLITALTLAAGFTIAGCGSQYDCCVDGQLQQCECPANAQCDPPPFAECGDGTCVVGDDLLLPRPGPTCPAEGEGEGEGE